MSEAPSVSPDLVRDVSQLARALMAAARSRALYPATHPTVRDAIERLSEAITEGASESGRAFAITPETLFIDDQPLPATPPIAEAARFLHDRDLVRLGFAHQVQTDTLLDLLEVLNKPDKLTAEEFAIMKRHVVDGVHVLRRTPEIPALAPVVAFEHHLKHDLSGYPEKVVPRKLNLCTMIVSIADVFDALRSTRPHREALASDRIKAIMVSQDDPSFNPTLLKRFVNLMGLFPVGNLARLNTDELAIVTA